MGSYSLRDLFIVLHPQKAIANKGINLEEIERPVLGTEEEQKPPAGTAVWHQLLWNRTAQIYKMDEKELTILIQWSLPWMNSDLQRVTDFSSSWYFSGFIKQWGFSNRCVLYVMVMWPTSCIDSVDLEVL